MNKARMTKAEKELFIAISNLVFTDPNKLISDKSNTPDPAMLSLLKEDVVAKFLDLRNNKTW